MQKDISKEIIDFWGSFIQENKEYEHYSIPATDSFCNEETLTNKLAELVKNGVKTATCSALIDYQISGDPLPQKNELKIIVDWNQKTICITKTINVTIKKYNEVDSDFARKEGEGDKSLAYWQKAHKTFFSNYLNTIGVEFTEELDLVCEEFEKIN